MTPEEKAKAYDKAINVARSKIKNDKDHVLYEEDITDIFPELKENENEKIRKELIETIHLAYDCGFSLNKEQHDKYIAWIEKQGEKKPTWSEEDDKMLDIILNDINYAQKNFSDSKLIRYSRKVYWLKSLKDRIQPKQGEQKPVEWSEEELATAKKDAFNEALDKIEYSSGEPTFDDGWSAAVSFFRKRNIVPQKQWKPSEEQIKAKCEKR